MDATRVIRRLRAINARALGHGCFGWVFELPNNPDRVIKVCENDGGALEFYEWCVAHQTMAWSLHLPKIYQIILGDGDGEFLIIMEKLRPANHNHPLREASNRYGKGDFIAMAVYMSHWCKSLAQCLYHLHLDFPCTKYYRDLHGQNFMIRGEQTVVITDPVVHSVYWDRSGGY